MIISSDDFWHFGRWANDNPDRLGAKSAWLSVERNNVQQKNIGKAYNMTDEKAAVIDRAVCALTNKNPTLGNVFTAHYVHGLTYRQLAEAQKCSRTVVSRQLSEAGGAVLGFAYCLDEYSKNNA